MARKPASRTKKWAVSVTGLDEIAARFESMPDTARAVAGDAVKDMGEVMAQRAGSQAPVGKSGELSNSIIVEGPLQERTGFGKTKINLGARGIDGAMVLIGPDTEHWYGIFPELGTSTISAKPYLRPTLDELGNKAVRVIGELMYRALI